jgi:integrase
MGFLVFMATRKNALGKAGDLSVTYGAVVVRIYPRADGQVAVSWREDGVRKRTTRATLEGAQEFARKTARAIDAAAGRRWMTPAQAERMAWLERIAGGAEEVPGLLHDLERAVEVLGSPGRIFAAADYFVSHGPAGVRAVSVHEAARAVLAEYDHSPKVTRATMRQALNALMDSLPDVPLTEVSREMLSAHVHKAGLGKRSVRNRLAQASTFFNRCRELGFWPAGRLIPTAGIKPPKLPDKAPGIFTPAHGKVMLRKTMADAPQYLTYLVTAGWLMCRPSECLRLRWENFDLDHAMLHLPAEVVGKTHRERWVPIPAALVPWLRIRRDVAASERVCLTTAREKLSKVARSHGIPWPKDVLRHSAITYRLQVLGSIEEVAEEAGNSPSVIRSSYRRPIPPGWGKQWFDLLELLTE